MRADVPRGQDVSAVAGGHAQRIGGRDIAHRKDVTVAIDLQRRAHGDEPSERGAGRVPGG